MPQGGGHTKITLQQNRKFSPKIQKQDLHTPKNPRGAKLRWKIQIPFAFFQSQHAVYQNLFISKYLAQNQINNLSILCHLTEQRSGCYSPKFSTIANFPVPLPVPQSGIGRGTAGGGSQLTFLRALYKICQKVEKTPYSPTAKAKGKSNSLKSMAAKPPFDFGAHRSPALKRGANDFFIGLLAELD